LTPADYFATSTFDKAIESAGVVKKEYNMETIIHDKIFKVIKSCKTQEHLKVASKMIDLFEKKIPKNQTNLIKDLKEALYVATKKHEVLS